MNKKETSKHNKAENQRVPKKKKSYFLEFRENGLFISRHFCPFLCQGVKLNVALE
jgi:hypothetical protein